MNEPLLTVVIPVYNAEAYVRRAAASVLNQPCADRIELILVDDGSTDGSGALCDQIAAESSSAAAVRVIHQKNGGVSSARNLGIQESRGAYLAFLDADDWWIDSFFDAEAVDLLGERFDVIQLSYLSVSPDLRWYLKYPVQDQEYRNLTPECDRPAPVTHWSCLYRKDLLLRHRIAYPPCRINEDVPFVQLAFALAESVKLQDRTMLCYWSNLKSCLHSSSAKDSLEESLRSLELEEDAFRARGLSLSNERVALSVFYTRLPRLCCETSYRNLMQYLEAPKFDLIRREDLEPWSDLKKSSRLFRSHPFLFWLKARLCEGLPLRIRRFLLAVPAFRRCVYWIQFRLIHNWKPYPGVE